MATDADKLADVMVQLAILKGTKEKQKRDLKVAEASKAVAKDAQLLLDGAKKSIQSLKKRRDVLVARLVRIRQKQTV